MTWHHPVNLVKSRDLVRIFCAAQYFTDQLFRHFTDWYGKIANLWHIDLKTSGFISETILRNFVKLACLEIAFPQLKFSGFWSVIQRPSQVCQFFLHASLWIPTSGKNFMVMVFMVLYPIYQGGWTCQKRQMPLPLSQFKQSIVPKTTIFRTIRLHKWLKFHQH